MGFLDKIKGAFDQLTGNAGTMQLQLSNNAAKRGETISFTAILTATGALKGKSVNVEIVSNEHIKYQVDVPSTTSSSSTTGSSTISTTREDRTKDSQTFQNKQVLAQGEFQMNEGETKQFSGQVQIPVGGQPTYNGIDATHTWMVRVFVDVPMGADITGESEIMVS